MKFIEGLQKAYNTKWSYINTFTVQFLLPPTLESHQNVQWPKDLNDYINLHLISIETPQFQNQPIEQFVANRWIVHNGRDELYRFTMTFRDKDQMALYRSFVKLYKHSRNDYFDNVKFQILLMKDADWQGEADNPLYLLEDVIVEAVGPLQFNNGTDNQIAEFTVNFKCIKPTIF